MRCAVCDADNDQVLESRPRNDGRTVRRRRKCKACGFRWTTYEMSLGECGDDVREEADLLLEAAKALRSRLVNRM